MEIASSAWKKMNHASRSYEAEPWSQPGWYERVTLWIRSVLNANNMVLETPIRQAYETIECMVMTCTVTALREAERWQNQGRELLFIKASYPILREGQRTLAIADVIGNIVPQVIAVHERDGTMIQRSPGKLGDDPFDQDALLNTVVHMQKLAMYRVEELEAGGLKVMDSEWLGNNVYSILHHHAFQDELWERNNDGIPTELYTDIVDTLRSKVELIQEACRQIASYRFPNTIVHGGLVSENIGSRKNSGGKFYSFYDWAKSFVGPPLYDFWDLLENVGSPEFPVNNERVLAEFSNLWMPSATRQEVESALRVTHMMRCLIEVHNITLRYDVCNLEERVGLFDMLREAVLMLCDSLARAFPWAAEGL